MNKSWNGQNMRFLCQIFYYLTFGGRSVREKATKLRRIAATTAGVRGRQSGVAVPCYMWSVNNTFKSKLQLSDSPQSVLLEWRNTFE